MMSSLTDWIGRTAVQESWLDPWRAQALHATLDAFDAPPRAGDDLPPCWHWVYFLDAVPSRLLGVDGHPQRGDFLPPVPLPRRMWAGSRIEFLSPLRLGEVARRESRVAAVQEKAGRSGRLCFVTVRHDTYCRDTLAIREEQDIVYREAAGAAATAVAQPAAHDARWWRDCTFDPPRLFRYSALTFNSHRIHYDRDYAVREEGYPGLVVHGPLLATLMLEVLRENAQRVQHFEYRALAPTFVDEASVKAAARPVDRRVAVWIADRHNGVRMSGAVSLA
jgi:3-methylfumaryl-CoA hydratase